MTVTASSLRLMFPEFGNTDTYPDPMLTQWIRVAVNYVNAAKWGDQTDFGVMLYTCHRVALQSLAKQAAEDGRPPGQFSGILTSKSGGGISASYDASSVTTEGDGHWNLTIYGLQFKELSRLFGLGPVQVGVETGANSNAAWPGVVYPFF